MNKLSNLLCLTGCGSHDHLEKGGLVGPNMGTLCRVHGPATVAISNIAPVRTKTEKLLQYILFLFLLRIMSPSKGCSPIGHPYNRAIFLCHRLQFDIGKRMLSSPPASPLPKYARNRIRAGRRTKIQPKRVIQASVCLARRPGQNHIIADSQQSTHMENPALLNVIDPD